MVTQERLSVKNGLIASAIILGIMILISGYATAVLPEGGRYPVHWNAAGQADGFGSKWEVVLLNPAIALVLTLLLSLFPRIEPRRANLSRSGKAYTAIWIAILLLLLLVHIGMVGKSLGWPVNITTLIGLGMGMMFAIIGNYLGKIKSNFIAGIRNPWTLSSDLSWNKTHRLSGKLFMLLGLGIAIGALVHPMVMLCIALGGAFITVVVSFVYSYQVWKADPQRK